MRTDSKPAWRNDMTFAFLLEIDCNPERYFRFVRRAKGAVCALSLIDQEVIGFHNVKISEMRGM